MMHLTRWSDTNPLLCLQWYFYTPSFGTTPVTPPTVGAPWPHTKQCVYRRRSQYANYCYCLFVACSSVGCPGNTLLQAYKRSTTVIVSLLTDLTLIDNVHLWLGYLFRSIISKNSLAQLWLLFIVYLLQYILGGIEHVKYSNVCKVCGKNLNLRFRHLCLHGSHPRDQCFIRTPPRGVLLFTPSRTRTPLDVPLHAPLLAGRIMYALSTFM